MLQGYAKLTTLLNSFFNSDPSTGAALINLLVANSGARCMFAVSVDQLRDDLKGLVGMFDIDPNRELSARAHPACCLLLAAISLALLLAGFILQAYEQSDDRKKRDLASSRARLQNLSAAV